MPVENNAALDLNQSIVVVDGGFLLHRRKLHLTHQYF